jgi:LysR family transcriptional regulator, mexEF-oprN operon transcriptional activator
MLMVDITKSYGRDLDLNLLRVFAVVAEEGSITRAASRLYVTQPAVSASMRRLTAFVGAELVTRQGRGVTLTGRGAELLLAARMHLAPLVAAAMAAPVFDPRHSTARIRFGVADGMEAVIVPALLARLRREAPGMQLVVATVQFRNVEEMLLTGKIDFAVTVADELPRSILRRSLMFARKPSKGFVCLYDSRFGKLGNPVTERAYFAREHVIVSYAGDARGVVEDALKKARTVRVVVPSFGHVADVVDGSELVATVPATFATHIVKTRPHLHMVALPFAMKSASLELLWLRATDEDAAARFVRGLVTAVIEAPTPRARATSNRGA